MFFSSRIKPNLISVILLSCILFPSGVFGTEKDLSTKKDSTSQITQPYDKFSIDFGGFFAGYNSGITLQGDRMGLGVIIDLEDLLGLNSSSWALRSKTNFRFGKTNRHQVSFGYFGAKRKVIRSINSDIDIGDITISAGTEVTTKFNFSIIRAKYDYSFFQDDRVSLGASIGLFVLPISYSLEVINKKDVAQSVVAPLPVIGIRSDFLITNKLFYRQSFEILYLSFDGFTGSILDLDLSLEYRPLKHFGFGMGLNATKFELETSGNEYPNVDFHGAIITGYTGVYVFAKYSL